MSTRVFICTYRSSITKNIIVKCRSFDTIIFRVDDESSSHPLVIDQENASVGAETVESATIARTAPERTSRATRTGVGAIEVG